MDKPKAKRKPRKRTQEAPVVPRSVIQTGPNRTRVDTACPRCGGEWTAFLAKYPEKQRQRRRCNGCDHTFWVDMRPEVILDIQK